MAQGGRSESIPVIVSTANRDVTHQSQYNNFLPEARSIFREKYRLSAL